MADLIKDNEDNGYIINTNAGDYFKWTHTKTKKKNKSTFSKNVSS